jgi:hypothetical protein
MVGPAGISRQNEGGEPLMIVAGEQEGNFDDSPLDIICMYVYY